MGHRVQLLVGSTRVLTRYRALVLDVGVYQLNAAASFLVLPFDAEVQDRFHRVYGTGEWLEPGGPQLSQGDMMFAAQASRAGALAYVETDYVGGEGQQSAVFWSAGTLALGPLSISRADQTTRPAGFWPINAVLRALGVVPQAGLDAFESLGLSEWRTNEAIVSSARRVTQL